MTKPSDFTADRVLEVQQPAIPEPRSAERVAWIYRLIALCLMIVIWLVIVVRTSDNPTDFAIGTALLIGIMIYSSVFTARSRRLAINQEKRLRLGLLVHNMELENMAMQDELTQLFNRRYFFDRMEREVETANAFGRPLAIILIDLDEMKATNDSYGHRVGDDLLRNFGRFLLDHTRGSDVPARIGGDEFAIILPDTPIAEARKLQERLAEKLDRTQIIDTNELTLKAEASFGCAGYPETASSVDDLIQQADSAMYDSKRDRKHNGRERSAAAGPTPVPEVFRSADVETS